MNEVDIFTEDIKRHSHLLRSGNESTGIKSSIVDTQVESGLEFILILTHRHEMKLAIRYSFTILIVA